MLASHPFSPYVACFHVSAANGLTTLSKREGGKSINLSVLVPSFQMMDADLLLLFDSCQALPHSFNSEGKGIASAITATGFEPGPTGIAAEVGPHSFTYFLTQVLGKLSIPSSHPNTPPTSDVTLHSLLVSELKRCNMVLEKDHLGDFKKTADGHLKIEPFRRRTPLYCWLSRTKAARSRLSPLGNGKETSGFPGPSMVPSATMSSATTLRVAEVLISVRLEPDSLDGQDVDSWARWILSMPAGPSGVSLKGHSITIEGVYPSLSSLVLLKMPLETWTRLPKYRAMTFIGHITGENQAAEVNRRLEERIHALYTQDFQVLSEESFRSSRPDLRGGIPTRPRVSEPRISDAPNESATVAAARFENQNLPGLDEFIRDQGAVETHPAEKVPFRYSCPYRKHNPRRFNPSNRRYVQCATGGWTSFQDLK